MTHNMVNYRIFGYITTILVHVINILYTDSCLRGSVMEDPRIKQYASVQTRFLTVWTFVLQIVHASVALACDYLVLKDNKKKNYKLQKRLEDARDILFDGILWPSTWIVLSFFWTLFLYDRELILPSYMDKFLTRTSNYIMHAFIIPVVMWEVMFRPKAEPRSHKRNLGYLIFYAVLYLLVMVYTYYVNNFWVYPIMGNLYGSIYFPLLILFLAAKFVTFYYMQWWVRRIIWGKVENEKVLEKSKKIT